MSAPNKLLISQFKTIIQALNTIEIEKLFVFLKKYSKNNLKKSSVNVGYKCWETIIEYDQIKASGFGRDEGESSNNSIRNFIDLMLEQEKNFQENTFALRNSLREIKDPNFQQNKVLNESNFWSDMNQSFEQNNSLEQLSKKIGDISMIKDQIGYDTQENISILYNLNNFKAKEQNHFMIEVQKPSLVTHSECSKTYCCTHEQELKKERLKVEHLELRMKLILEENRILKSMVQDQRLQNNEKNIQKNNGNCSEYYFKLIQNIKKFRRNTSYKGRPGSVDETRKIQKSDQPMRKILNELNYQNEITIVPKLNLESLPGFHGKQNQSINPQLISLYQHNHKQK